MICPACKSENEMSYSVLIHGFVCPEPACGLELEMEHTDAEMILADQLHQVGGQREGERVVA